MDRRFRLAFVLLVVAGLAALAAIWLSGDSDAPALRPPAVLEDLADPAEPLAGRTTRKLQPRPARVAVESPTGPAGGVATGVRGRVLDGRSRQPLQGVEVVALRRAPAVERLEARLRGLLRRGLWQRSEEPVEILGRAVTGPDGRFEILGLPDGTVFLDGRSERIYVRTAAAVRLARGEVREGVELLGAPAGRVRGRVLLPDGRPAAGAVVNLRPGLNAFLGQITHRRYRWMEVRTDEDGRFDFLGAPPGTGYTVSATHPGMAIADAHGIEVRVGETTTVTLRGAAGARVAGRVLDPGGVPLAGAQVAMIYVDLSRLLLSADGRGEPIATDEDGAFRIEHVAAGRIALVAVAPGHASSAVQQITVVDGGVYDDVELLLGEGHTLRGRVVDEQGAPLAGARVDVRPLERPPRRMGANPLLLALKIRNISVATGSDGRFEARGLEGERLLLQVRKPGYVTEVRFGVPVDVKDLEIRLVRGATIVGRVLHEDRTPVQRFAVRTRSRPAKAADDTDEVASALRGDPEEIEASFRRRGFRPRDVDAEFRRVRRVRLPEGRSLGDRGFGDAGGTWREVRSPDGRFELTGIPPGRVTVRVRAEGLQDGEPREIQVASGARSEELEFVLKDGCVARGTVVDATTGAPVPEAVVSAHTPSARRSFGPFRIGLDPQDFDFLGLMTLRDRRTAVTDSQGRFEIGGLTPGHYRFSARHPDLAKASVRDVEVAAGGPTEGIVIRISSGGAIAGKVTGAGNRPLSDALVLAFSLSAGALKSTSTRPDGTYRIDGLTPGQYVVFKSRMDERAADIAFELMGNMRLKAVTVRAGKVTRLDIHDEAEGTVRVYGSVLDGGRPVARALVTALSSDRHGVLGIGVRARPTDEKGSYELIGLEPGQYFFQVSRFAGRPEQARLAVHVPEGVSEYRVDLEIPQSRIRGVVVDGSGRPVSGIVVRAGIERGGIEAPGLLGVILSNSVAQARTDTEGRFEFRSMAQGVYRISASGRRGRAELRKYGEARVSGIVVDGRTPVDGIVLTLPLAGGLEGVVVDADGVPVQGAEVTYEREDRSARRAPDPADLFGLAVRPARTGADGRFSISGVTPGTYTVRAALEGRAPGIAEGVVVTEGQTTTVSLRVVRGATLRVRVRNVDGRTIPPARVRVVDSKGRPVLRSTSVFGILGRMLRGGGDEKARSGWIDVGSVAPDTYTIIVSEPGKPDIRLTRRIRDGERAVWEFDLAAELKARGRERRR